MIFVSPVSPRTKMMTLMHEQATRLRLSGETIGDDDLISILNNVYDGFERYSIISSEDPISDESLKVMRSFCKHMAYDRVYTRIIRPRIINHDMFSFLGSSLSRIFGQAIETNTTEDETMAFIWSVFHAIATLFISSLRSENSEQKKTNRLIQEAFFSEEFLRANKKTIESLLSDYHPHNHVKYRISSYILQNVYIICENSDPQLKFFLLTPILKAMGSKLYADLYTSEVSGPIELLLCDCPYFIRRMLNDYEKCIIESITEPFLQNADLIFKSYVNRRSDDLKYSTFSGYFSNYLHLLNRCLLAESTRNSFLQYGSQLVINLFTIVEKYAIIDHHHKAVSVKNADLLAIALTILYNLMFDYTIRMKIAQNIQKSPIPLLANINEKSISHNDKQKNQDIHKHIQFPARSLIALTIEDIDKLSKVEDVTSDYISYLSKAVRNEPQVHEGVHAGTILSDVKTIAQNREVKIQLVKQKALPLLTKCACDPKFDAEKIQQPALEAIWTVSFNGKASDLWKKDEKFKEKLEALLKSERNEQKLVADGILWRLVNEERFIGEQSKEQRTLPTTRISIEDHDNYEDEVWVKVKAESGYTTTCLREKLTKEQRDNIVKQRTESAKPKKKIDTPYKYDLMISYCHENAEICDILYECLSKMKKYAIWYDKKQMHGSLMERMAEAIEESHIILICMSSKYKGSQACQSEGNYAWIRKRETVFLKVEPKYKPNGWLGILLGSNYYIDVSKKAFTLVLKDLIEQISRKRGEIPDTTLVDSIVTAEIEQTIADALMKLEMDHTRSIAKMNSKSKEESTITPPKSSTTLAPTPVLIYPSEISSNETTRRNSYSSKPVFTEIIPLTKTKKDFSNAKYPLLNFSNTPTPRVTCSPLTSDHLPSIHTSQGPLKSDTPISGDLFTIDHEPCTAEELAELYPFDFEYGSESDGDDDDLINYIKDKTRKQSISSISEDDDDVFQQSLDPDFSQPIKPFTNDETKVSLTKGETSYEMNSLNTWTHKDVHQFFVKHDLFKIYPLLQEVDGKHLVELYNLSKPTSPQALEALRTKLNTSSVESIPLRDFKRFQHEIEKLLPAAKENEKIFCTLM